MEKPFSVFQNSQPLELCRKKDDCLEEDELSNEPKANPMLLFFDIKFYFVNIAQIAFLLRLRKFKAKRKKNVLN